MLCFSQFTVGPRSQWALISSDQKRPLLSFDFSHAEKPTSVALDEMTEAVCAKVLETLSLKAIKKLLSVVVCPGPGSFTGIRVGVASAQAFCRALEVPLYELHLPEILFQMKDDAVTKNSLGSEAWSFLDGRNGFFTFARIERGGKSFEFVPYSEVSSWVQKIAEKGALWGYAADEAKLMRLSGQRLPFIAPPLDEVHLAEKMAVSLLQCSEDERDQKKFKAPIYGLEAFTTKISR